MTNTGATCANCARVRQGPYCTHCGQNERDYRRSLPPMVWQLLQEAFDFDGRIVRSLKLLFFHPGRLSVEFSNNRRASYISPVRLYLFTSLLFFFVLSFDIQLQPVDATLVLETDQVNLEQETASIDRLKQVVAGELHATIDAIHSRNGTVAREILGGIAELGSAALETAEAENQPVPRWQRFTLSQAIRSLDNPAQTVSEFLDMSPIALFFLLPAYALLLKIIYWRSGKYYVEHLVYALHLHALVFLVFTAFGVLPENATIDTIRSVVFVVLLIYYYKSLRTYYEQGRAKTLIKFGFLLTAYSALLIPAILLVMITTVTFL